MTFTQEQIIRISGFLLIGLVSGGLAAFITGGRRSGCITNTILGVIGALVGGFLFEKFGSQGITGINAWSFFVAFIGAVVVVVGARVLRRF